MGEKKRCANWDYIRELIPNYEHLVCHEDLVLYSPYVFFCDIQMCKIFSGYYIDEKYSLWI